MSIDLPTDPASSGEAERIELGSPHLAPKTIAGVGMRVFLVLLEGRDGADPVFLQIKQPRRSVYEAYRGPSRDPNDGERVVVGKRLIQSATDIFAGFTSVDGNDVPCVSSVT